MEEGSDAQHYTEVSTHAAVLMGLVVVWLSVSCDLWSRDCGHVTCGLVTCGHVIVVM